MLIKCYGFHENTLFLFSPFYKNPLLFSDKLKHALIRLSSSPEILDLQPDFVLFPTSFPIHNSQLPQPPTFHVV